jgi:hypothetical protein
MPASRDSAEAGEVTQASEPAKKLNFLSFRDALRAEESLFPAFKAKRDSSLRLIV